MAISVVIVAHPDTNHGRMKSVESQSEILDKFSFTTALLRLFLILNKGTPAHSELFKFQADGNPGGGDDDLEAISSILSVQHEIIATCYTSEAATVVVASQAEIEMDLYKTTTPEDFWPEVKQNAWFCIAFG